MLRTKIKSYAKVNLSLAITGTDGGYHTLDSLVASIDLYDLIALKPRKDRLVNVYMHGQGSENIPPEKNNAVKAGELFVETFQTNGADIEIYKNIPIGAGLGGSSADIAGVLRAMAKAYKIDADLKPLAAKLGSDTVYMLEGGYARMRGRGEIIEKIDCNRELNLLLFLPDSGVSAGASYRKYDELNKTYANTTDGCISALIAGDCNALGRCLQNDLYEASAILNPDVRAAMADAEDFSPCGAVMTGSGSAVVALFEHECFCDWAKSRYRGKFRVAVAKTVVKTEKILKNPFALSQEDLR